jgi:DNA polymerase-3 subunit delta
VLQRSPFCSQCSAELATALEASLPQIPDSVHLKLISTGKPDARLRTTKALRVR